MFCLLSVLLSARTKASGAEDLHAASLIFVSTIRLQTREASASIATSANTTVEILVQYKIGKRDKIEQDNKPLQQVTTLIISLHSSQTNESKRIGSNSIIERKRGFLPN